MNKTSEKRKILEPIKQLYLYGYDFYFDSFTKLYKRNKLPPVLLISGPKGLGKSTFIYHFINYLLSINEEKTYSVKEKLINFGNRSLRLLSSNTHPNFFSLKKNHDQKNIGIEEVRKMISFLNKSTFSKNLKLIMIDNAENLNIHSSNAFLKSLEEVKTNTFFFIICHNLSKISSTIKSRSVEFKIFFNHYEKKQTFLKILKNEHSNIQIENALEKLSFDTPGNLLKYLTYITTEDNDEYPKIISLFIQKYISERNSEDLTLISLLIEIFYNKLLISHPYDKFKLFFNRSNILNKINLFKKLNLDSKDTFFYIENILRNETR